MQFYTIRNAHVILQIGNIGEFRKRLVLLVGLGLSQIL